jgi:uncharacterized LabA/DUF88 family protein
MSRVVVFVEYCGTCLTGEQTFGDLDASSKWSRQIDPLLLAGELTRQGGEDRQLSQVRVYRAVPDGRVDPTGFSLALRQMSQWSERGLVVIRQSVDESDGGRSKPVQHKGLAIALAIDLMTMAWRDQYDIGIVCSRDGDLAASLKAVLDQTWKGVEVASWRRADRPSSRLSVPGEHVPCRWLDRVTYDAVVDRTDYSAHLA